MALSAGTRLGRYEIRSKIGALRAQQSSLKSAVVNNNVNLLSQAGNTGFDSRRPLHLLSNS